MGSYRLTEDAKADLIRIYQRGLREYGEGQADAYYDAFFNRFELLAERSLSYPAVDDIRVGYRRSVCGADSIYYRIEGEAVGNNGDYRSAGPGPLALTEKQAMKESTGQIADLAIIQ